GQFDQAGALLAEAHEQYERAGDRSEALATETRIAESLVLAGEAAEALERAEATLARVGVFEGIAAVVPTLQRIRGLALMQLGRLEEAREALSDSVGRARIARADYELALALDTMVLLGQIGGVDPRAADLHAFERERDSILSKLGVVSTPTMPRPPRDRELLAAH